MSAWDDIRDNFKNLMEVEIVNYVTNLYRETPSGIEIKRSPNSIFNGCYSLSVQGMPSAGTEVNSLIIYDYVVQIQIGFIINQEAKNNPDTKVMDNSKSEYNAAVNDVEQIIRRRMDVSTWIKDEAYQIDQVVFQGASPITFLDEIENYATCDIRFLVSREVPF